MRWFIPSTPDHLAGLGALVRVPKHAVDAHRLRRSLTVKNDHYWQQLQGGYEVEYEPEVLCFEEDERFFYVPRHYEVPWTKRTRVRDERPKRRKIEQFKHRIVLRKGGTQTAASAALLADHDDKIISLACGKGKTVVSLHAASEGDRAPLLIVVHTNALMDQWRERILEFWDCEPGDIGHVQGPVCDWKGKKVVIAMLHSLAMKKYPARFYSYFKTIIFDEVHKLGAEFFRRVASQFSGERWGLSATVEREDKMDKVFRMHLGEIVYEDLEQDLVPRVTFVKTGVKLKMGGFMFRRMGRPNLGALYTKISNHEKRNALILRYIRRKARKGRTILALGERVAQLHMLGKELRDRGFDAVIHVGAMDKHARREALTHRIVLATQHLAKEGLDRPAFDTLFIFIPFAGKGRFQQSTGRILRSLDGKKATQVYIFVDNIGVIAAIANKMRRHAHVMGYEVKEVAA